MLINSNKFNFSFFLSSRKPVTSLEAGAIENGGATKINNTIYSNIPGNEYISVNNDNNSLSVFIPSTIDVNNITDNTEYIQYAINYLKRYYNSDDIIFEAANGSWYSEDLNKVVIEDITIITVNAKAITETDINIFIDLANYIKDAMKQEGVSISINDSLAII